MKYGVIYFDTPINTARIVSLIFLVYQINPLFRVLPQTLIPVIFAVGQDYSSFSSGLKS